MLKKTVAVICASSLSIMLSTLPTRAEQTATQPILTLWEFDGWTPPTTERPLGLRFALLDDGRVVFSPDEPANDMLIPNRFFQARLSQEESENLGNTIATILQAQTANAKFTKDHGWTEFYFRDVATGREWRAEVSGHPCLATGRVFSANAAISSEQAARNSSDRAALTEAFRNACNVLAGFHHSTSRPWIASEFPAPLPIR
ncbi:MAG: hypothetical protein U1F34_04975 [Gammaproteobacteria bacterium]